MVRKQGRFGVGPMQLTVCLPTYNERDNLPRMVEELLALEIDGIDDLSVLVIDDASPDGTGLVADELAAAAGGRVSVLHRAAKEGLGRAYVDGFTRALQAGADLVLQMDCDFSHQPHYIPDMVALLLESGADMVLGSRFMPGGSVDASWGWWRQALSHFANDVYLRTVLPMGIADATGGFRLWRRRALLGMDLMHRVRSNGYVFMVETAYLAHCLGYEVREMPIHFPDRTAGASKMNLTIQLEAARRVWDVRRRLSSLTAADRVLEEA